MDKNNIQKISKKIKKYSLNFWDLYNWEVEFLSTSYQPSYKIEKVDDNIFSWLGYIICYLYYLLIAEKLSKDFFDIIINFRLFPKRRDYVDIAELKDFYYNDIDSNPRENITFEKDTVKIEPIQMRKYLPVKSIENNKVIEIFGYKLYTTKNEVFKPEIDITNMVEQFSYEMEELFDIDFPKKKIAKYSLQKYRNDENVCNS